MANIIIHPVREYLREDLQRVRAALIQEDERVFDRQQFEEAAC
jgi:hypothetical protein